MKWIMRGCGVGIGLLGVFVISVAVTARLDATGEPYPPVWIAAVSIFGLAVALGTVMAVMGEA